MTSSAKIKYFTVEQANKMLPLVSSIVRDVVTTYTQFKEKSEILEKTPGSLKIREEKEELEERLDQFVQELVNLGVELKSFDLGLVDFYTKRDGRVAFLCWKLGEEKVNYWHELETGFSGRQPL